MCSYLFMSFKLFFVFIEMKSKTDMELVEMNDTITAPAPENGESV